MKRSFLKAGLAAAVLGSAVLAPVNPAMAAGNSSCPNNKVCVWDFRNFETYLVTLGKGASGTFNYRTPYVGNNLNDKISSYSIGYSTGYYKYVTFYQDSYNPNATTGSGYSFYDKNGHRYAEMHRINHPDGNRRGWEDRVSSFDEAN